MLKNSWEQALDGNGARTHQIGDWTFVPESHELVRGDEHVRLEHRAASLLAYLCARRGEVVSREALMAHVWGGRHVSANSLPTAMHAIRRALGDDAKNPLYLQTVAKGGYRLIAPDAAAAQARTPQPSADATRRFLLAAAGIAALALVATAGVTLATPAPTTLILTDLPNQTGDPSYDTTARASESVLVEALGHHRAYRIRRSADGAAPGDVQLSARLVLWSGLPDVVVEARDVRTQTVLWSGFACGPEPTLPQKINELVAAFVARPQPRTS